jgi:hypothetical protein
MTYDERVRVILSELIKMMQGYATPKHLDTRQKEEDEARNIVRMLNQKFPKDTTEDHIRGTMDRAMLKLKEAHKSRTWPTAADISAAVSKSMSTAKSSLPKGNGTWKPNSLEINAKRIKAGEPVGQMYIQGKLAERMVRDGLVTEEELAPYLVYIDAHRPLTHRE